MSTRQPSYPGSAHQVYGAQFPPIYNKEDAAVSLRKKKNRNYDESFGDFERDTKDAWSEGLISPDVALSSAEIVLDRHRQSDGRGGAQQSPVVDGDSPVAAPRAPNSAQKLRPTPVPRLADMPVPSREETRCDKFHALLERNNSTIEELRRLSWPGVPDNYRPLVWKILAGYVPLQCDQREAKLKKARGDYQNWVASYFTESFLQTHKDTYRQIHIDIPRMCPLIGLFQQKVVQDMFERILFIWSLQHQGSGYVQGMNDLVTPFFVVFLTEYLNPGVEVEQADLATMLTEDEQRQLEADSFWCFTRLLDCIQDNYTFANPGIQKKVAALEDVIKRINSKLHEHLEANQVRYLQFSFRWMNNLLMRELPLRCTIRLWDTYLSEGENQFYTLHLYVCAALMQHFADRLLSEKDFQGLMLFLQSLPTRSWTNDNISLILADAYRLKCLFADAPRHLQSSNQSQSSTARPDT